MEYQRRVDRVVDRLHAENADFAGGETHSFPYYADGNYVDVSAYERITSGEEYASWRRTAGPPDLQRGMLADRDAVRAVSQDFAAEQGWGVDVAGDAEAVAGNVCFAVERPAGKQSREFREWFGESKIVDSQGRPLAEWRRDDEAIYEYTQGGRR